MTADELALLRGVEAAPDDDLPRLVYADWLDEHGRHARAEFIRVQCELTSIERRLPGMTLEEKRVAGPRRGQLLKAERKMYETRLSEYIGFESDSVSKPNGNLYWSFVQRGFISEYAPHIYGPEFETEVLVYAAMTPRPKISLCCLEAVLRDRERHDVFSNSALWAEVNEVSLTHGYGPAETLLPHELIPMMAPDYPALRSFVAGISGLNPGHVCVIAERLKAPNLERLDLSRNDIVDSGVSFLHRAIYAKSLREIDLSNNPLCRPAVGWLTPERFPSLQHIDVSLCPITPDSLSALRAQLPGVVVHCQQIGLRSQVTWI